LHTLGLAGTVGRCAVALLAAHCERTMGIISWPSRVRPLSRIGAGRSAVLSGGGLRHHTGYDGGAVNDGHKVEARPAQGSKGNKEVDDRRLVVGTGAEYQQGEAELCQHTRQVTLRKATFRVAVTRKLGAQE
jgi:hypothetical protein